MKSSSCTGDGCTSMRTPKTRTQQSCSGCYCCYCCFESLPCGDGYSSRHRSARSGRTGTTGHDLLKDVCHNDNNHGSDNDDAESAGSSTW